MKTKDPVCGMEVSEDEAPFSAEYKGKTYPFCSKSCRDRFLQDPERYVAPAGGAAEGESRKSS